MRHVLITATAVFLACVDVRAEEPDAASLGIVVCETADVQAVLKEEKSAVVIPKNGVFVLAVDRFGSLGKGGVQVNDVIFMFDGKKISSVTDWKTVTGEAKPGSTCKVQYQRPKGGLKKPVWTVSQSMVKMISWRESALASLVEKKDDVRDVKFYWHADSEQDPSKVTQVAMYISEPKGGARTAFIRFQLRSADLFDTQRVLIKAGDVSFSVVPRPTAVKRDFFRGGGGWYEWFDQPVEGDGLEMVEALTKAPSATIRFESRETYIDHEPTKNELRHIQCVWAARQFLPN